MQNADVEAAVSAALSLDWETAKKLNEVLLKECPNDVDCLNRLGRAYLELGSSKKAAQIFRQVLRLSRYDPIATKNLARATQSPKRRQGLNGGKIRLPINFIEEPGKTKLISLVNVAPTKVLLTQDYANPVKFTPRRHTILVCDFEERYLGALPDDLGHRLLVLIRGGNKYEGFVKSVSKNSITIFVREVSRGKRFYNTPSFTSTGGDYLSYLREESSEDHKVGGGSDEDETEDEISPRAKNLHTDEESGEVS